MNTPDGLGSHRNDFTLGESFAMLQQASDVYRGTAPAPPEAKKSWLRDTDREGIYLGLIIEHPESTPPRHASQTWLLAGVNIGAAEQPEIELITELADVDDLAWLFDHYDSSEAKKARTAISSLAYFTLRRALAGNFMRSAGRLVWGITEQRRLSEENINPRELVQLAYELVDA